MKYSEFTKLIQQRISSLSREKQLALAIKICKNLFLDYQTFSQTYQWGNPDYLLDGINLCEKALNSESDIHQAKELIPLVYSVTPDIDEFGSELGSYALNASASVHESLEFLIDNNKTHIINIATYYTDTIDFKIQENGESTEEQIDNDPLMISARAFLLSESQ